MTKARITARTKEVIVLLDFVFMQWQFILVGIAVAFSIWQLSASVFFAILLKSKSFFIQEPMHKEEVAVTFSCFQGACSKCSPPKKQK